LGSDVPFFFAAPAAWCTGRGEKVEPVRLGRPLDLVLASPTAGLSTAEVFRGVTPAEAPLTGDEARQAAEAGDIEELGRRLHNRLQAPAERLLPAVAAAKERLAALRPAGVLMTGSGSTVFALCRSPLDAQRVARGVISSRDGGADDRVRVVRSCV